MTPTPKRDLTELFPAPPALELPPGLEFMRHSIARGLEVSNLPESIDADALITNLGAAFGQVNDYAKPSGHKFKNRDQHGTQGLIITFDQPVHYPTLMNVFAEVLDSEYTRMNMCMTEETIPQVLPVDMIEDPSNPPPRADKYSGPRFRGH